MSEPAPLRYPIERTVDLDPPAEYNRLRDEQPVAQVTMPTGDPAYLVTRYEDVRHVLASSAFSTDRSRPGAPAPVAMSRDDSMLGKDPPEHTRLRRLVLSAFTPRRVEQQRPRIEKLTNDLLHTMAACSPPVDLNAAVAHRLPLLVLGELLGVPPVDQARLQRLSHRMVSYTAFGPQEMAAARAELRGYVGELIDHKRARPGDDLLTGLIAAHDGSDRLSTSELLSQTMLLLVAGHETTANQIGNGVVALLRHPDAFDRIRQNPELVSGAVEELLRHDPPGDAGQYRVALEDVELSGVRISAGQAVLACIPSANRDDRVFPDPHRLDIMRPVGKHLAFGHGAHFCLGASLARAELQIVLATLSARFPRLRLAIPAEHLRWVHGVRVGSYAEIPVAW